MSETAPDTASTETRPADGPPRAAVSPAAAWISGLVATGALLAACCVGGGGVALHAAARSQADRLRRRAADAHAVRAEQHAADELLDVLRDRLLVMHRARRAFPAALPEAPPEDPWGTPVRYERTGPDRAWLTSAGADREFGTADDVGFAIEPE